MSDFFHKLESQRRYELLDISLGAVLGIEAVAGFVRLAIEPTSLIQYAPTLGGALVGACLAAGIIERRQS
jgi:hypothetical protein